MIQIRAISLTIILTAFFIQAGIVVPDSLKSITLGRTLYFTMILPDNYQQATTKGIRYPVVYLLHCLGCRSTSWTDSAYGAQANALINSFNFIIAAPDDGSVGSWWLDSPKKSGYNYTSFLAGEFKNTVDNRYATIKDRSHTGVAGHSMGGFGALHLIIEHPEIYGAAYGIKGGYDLRLPRNATWPSDFGLGQVLGTTDADQPNWQAVNILSNITRLKEKNVRIAFYAGRFDTWFYGENVQLHQIMDSATIPHTFTILDEDHFTVPDSSMRRVMNFFDTSFASASLSAQPDGKKKARETVLRSTGNGHDVRLFDIHGRMIHDKAATDRRRFPLLHFRHDRLHEQ